MQVSHIVLLCECPRVKREPRHALYNDEETSRERCIRNTMQERSTNYAPKVKHDPERASTQTLTLTLTPKLGFNILSHIIP